MYGAMREHAPSSTRLAGVITAAAVTAGMAGLLALGVGHAIAKPPLEPILFSVLPDEPRDVLPEPDRRLDVTSDQDFKLLAPVRDILVFVAEEPPIRGSTEPPTGPGTDAGAGTGPAPRAVVKVGAKLLPGTPPPYPASEVRRGNEGVSSLHVCLNARGRVTEASLAKSSGHKALDQAALKWVRDAKFSPATVDGAAQSVCGHTVDYEWTLDKR
jgi:TonB family protein